MPLRGLEALIVVLGLRGVLGIKLVVPVAGSGEDCAGDGLDGVSCCLSG